MLTQKNLVLTRAEPKGDGGLQFLYRIKDYGIACVSPPKEEVSQIQWEAEVIQYKNDHTFQYETCYTTDLAQGKLVFRNDKKMNEFLEKAFAFFNRLQKTEES